MTDADNERAREKALERLHAKRRAYLHTFCGDGDTLTPPAADVLADLRRFCGINRGGIVVSPASRQVDPYATCYRAGMRDVYLRILNFLQLDEGADLEQFLRADVPDPEESDARSDTDPGPDADAQPGLDADAEPHPSPDA